MEQKKRITTLNVAIAQLTSALLLPIVWSLIGTIIVWLLIESGRIPDNIAYIVYYTILIISYYVGLKYSFYYVSKNLTVTQPKKSAKISIFLFYFGLVAIYIGFYFYYNNHNYYRMASYLIIAFIYTIMTNKYFLSLEPDNKLNEYSFILQVCFTVVNFSLVVMLAIITIWLIMEYPWTEGLYIALVFLWLRGYGTKINNFLFLPYFYKNGEKKPYKKLIIILFLSIPINILLFYLISIGALFKG